jgi:methionyl-tRNA formyltransferase
MATATLPSSPSFPQFTITSEEISRYAELTSLLTELEKQKDELRAELLELYADGAEQEETGPYLLNFIDQDRRTVDWKSEALSLAATVYGVEGLTAWKIQMEQSAPVQAITSIRVRPNPAFAAGLARSVGVAAASKKPAGSVPARGLATAVNDSR